jgi:hypothetical protein
VSADESRVDVGSGVDERGDRGCRAREVAGPVGGDMKEGARPAVPGHDGGRKFRVIGEELTEALDVSGTDRVNRCDGKRVAAVEDGPHSGSMGCNSPVMMILYGTTGPPAEHAREGECRG